MNKKIFSAIAVISAFVIFGVWYCINYSSIRSVHIENISNNGKDSIDKSEISSENRNEETVEKININTANEVELSALNGIGAKRAADIVEYRKTNGEFKDIESIKNVDGIGEGTFNLIKEYITV